MPSLGKIINHPLFNIGFFLLVRQLTKSLPLEDSSYLWGIRGVYYGAQLLIFLLNLYILNIISNKNDQTVLRYVEPSKPSWDGTTTPDNLVVTTFADYDKNEVLKGMKQSVIGLAMVTFLHFKFGYVQPLIIQAVLGFKTFFTTKEARIHLFHQSTTSGDLKRPFRVDSPFGMSSLNPQPKTDKASIKKAERAMKAD
ncbi:inorganic phosphate transporter Pho88 [Halteromyces radiatus]|uniref:inorganic phosphate transporter Pho88 n=1 Tax=Halteromyces radiatus TaxID=101107 RepID=UPI00221FFFB9|nr:inorganic phosphate transporter Pho88 [Halteromyces radiatus]KAI8083143.1 inorganic phosphate transporter Pho88 [Halteromyces radiatus]